MTYPNVFTKNFLVKKIQRLVHGFLSRFIGDETASFAERLEV